MKTTKQPRQQFAITLEALADDLRPPEIRLRQILKLCLRGFRMKCVAVEERKPAEPIQEKAHDDHD